MKILTQCEMCTLCIILINHVELESCIYLNHCILVDLNKLTSKFAKTGKLVLTAKITLKGQGLEQMEMIWNTFLKIKLLYFYFFRKDEAVPTCGGHLASEANLWGRTVSVQMLYIQSLGGFLKLHEPPDFMTGIFVSCLYLM